MSEMSFLPELKDFLLKNGFIYTVRKYKMSEALVEIEGVGQCRREPLGTIEAKAGLLPFIESSGFSTVDTWWKKIKYFIPGDDIKYLYRVGVVR